MAIHDEQRTDELARRVIARARAALGHDLQGWSLVDLLADNMPLSLDEIRRVLVRIGERKEQGNEQGQT